MGIRGAKYRFWLPWRQVRAKRVRSWETWSLNYGGPRAVLCNFDLTTDCLVCVLTNCMHISLIRTTNYPLKRRNEDPYIRATFKGAGQLQLRVLEVLNINVNEYLCNLRREMLSVHNPDLRFPLMRSRTHNNTWRHRRLPVHYTFRAARSGNLCVHKGGDVLKWDWPFIWP